ncbi:MAG: SDR family NAD(P)-dependent oxidoreductase [Burkholderiales bacterium]|nr:MAG: SDR family NAD(P)-dependent oxidoreductase [Betaproteobacteria bacterium]TAG84743.1 MAG: SDR family NAD(P)-dependent oxidoreductase [Burkholderiales bacterium]
MTQHLFILTGASRGMGYAMAEQLLQSGAELLCISRNERDELNTVAAQHNRTLSQWRADLSDASATAERLRAWLHEKAAAHYASVTLINNAALLPKIAPLRESSAADIALTLRVGLESVMMLTAAFLDATQSWTCPRNVLNISSGNGRRAMASQSIYSAVKAGMDHYTRCVAEEEKLVTNGAKLCSLAPGIIDTDMQTHLRESDPSKFPAHATFVDFKLSGHLLTPEAGAARVLAYLAREDFGVNPVADVRDA